MGRTNVVVDEELVERARRLYGLRTKREIIDLALRRLVGGDEKPWHAALTLEGSGRCCRLAGRAVRKMTDCLIAVATISAGATLLHRDAAFDTLAAHTPLQLHLLLESTEHH